MIDYYIYMEDKIKQQLKHYYPNYQITNASARSRNEILKIAKFCQSRDNLIVFSVRNGENEDIFKDIF